MAKSLHQISLQKWAFFPVWGEFCKYESFCLFSFEVEKYFSNLATTKFDVIIHQRNTNFRFTMVFRITLLTLKITRSAICKASIYTEMWLINITKKSSAHKCPHLTSRSVQGQCLHGTPLTMLNSELRFSPPFVFTCYIYFLNWLYW